MNHKKLTFPILITGLALSIGLVSTPKAHALEGEELNAAIKEYLMNNGDVIMDAVQAYQVKQQEEENKKASENVSKLLPQLTDKNAPSAGNPEGDITVIEFFDYNCGYCKRAVPDILATLEADKDVRFVFREMPILSPASTTAAKWALAAHKQDKYFEFHAALMEHRGQKDEKSLSKLAEDVGLDSTKMAKDAASDEIAKQIEKDLEYAREVGIRGTPAFIIDGKLHRGYLGPDGLKSAIAKARENKG